MLTYKQISLLISWHMFQIAFCDFVPKEDKSDFVPEEEADFSSISKYILH